MRIGLVLGAGGTTGAAFHAGSLLALEQDLGWDPREAEIVVGSSAGSIVGSLLRAGLTTDDLAAWGAVAEPSESGRQARVLLDELEQSGYPLAPGRATLALPRAAMLRNMLHPSRLRLHTAVMSMIPYGWIDAGRSLQRLGELVNGWPDRALWITAVRTADAQRVVFGRDPIDHPVSLGRAVAASCAIPAVFRPVRIGGHRYIDGGAHSPTNADVLVGSGVDVAIVLSPMSAQQTALRRRPDHVLRSLFARRLRIECTALRKAGIEVHVLEPDAAALTTMGLNALDRKRSAAVVRESFLCAGDTIVGNARLREILGSERVAPRAVEGIHST